MTRKQQKEIIKVIAKIHKVRVYYFNYESRGWGFHAVRRYKNGKVEDSIYISNQSPCLLSVFFHELGHSHCYRNKIWAAYHRCDVKWRKQKIVYPKELMIKIIRTGYKAERWVDRWAEKRLKLINPKIKYRSGYDGTKESKKWLDDNHLSFYRNKLKNMRWKSKIL